MRELVLDVVSATEALAAEKKLALEVDVPADLPRGHGDERRLTQVLMNLVSNAIKFTDAGSVSIRAKVEDSSFLVAVSDTGVGIAPEDRERIFEEFQQVDSSSTRKKGGTGLGLAIARRIVELHGGRIWVEFDPGPRLDLRLHPAAAGWRAGESSMTQRILVVEDQEDNRRIIRDLLMSAGYELIEATDGEAGVRLAEAERPDLILMDIQLPVLDGHEATRRIRQNAELAAIPIIVVTSYALSGDDAKAMAAGADGYVAKPFSPRQLLATIRKFLPEGEHGAMRAAATTQHPPEGELEDGYVGGDPCRAPCARCGSRGRDGPTRPPWRAALAERCPGRRRRRGEPGGHDWAYSLACDGVGAIWVRAPAPEAAGSATVAGQPKNA